MDATRHMPIMTPGLKVTAAILAGGGGRRLGGIDKTALSIHGRTILERQVAVLRTLTNHILIVAHRRSRFDHAGVTVVVDRIDGAGPLGGLYTALVEAPTDQVLVVAGDLPYVTGPFLAHLATLGDDVDGVVPRDDRGLHPLCACYHRRIADHLRTRLDAGALTVRDALAGLNIRTLAPGELAPFDPDGRLLLNVNTPDDYARACAVADVEPLAR